MYVFAFYANEWLGIPLFDKIFPLSLSKNRRHNMSAVFTQGKGEYFIKLFRNILYWGHELLNVSLPVIISCFAFCVTSNQPPAPCEFSYTCATNTNALRASWSDFVRLYPFHGSPINCLVMMFSFCEWI